ncbi:Hypothetical protein I595_3402 [Croceitalea dokdonensis DOKDO 023]|uniref:Uncharacterized protein n=1 Tax=Croceitalea dokdonensis DOKDO 023 TaxID=1300341 RepID=A0A0P7ARP8_9FLAO|nr:Hypothetical protein I595_3402 [Croceitalea dokdonensis DOKDO 023]
MENNLVRSALWVVWLPYFDKSQDDAVACSINPRYFSSIRTERIGYSY